MPDLALPRATGPACGAMSPDVEGLGPCVRNTGHANMHEAERGTKWGMMDPGECWCCEGADDAMICSACGGHGDAGRVPVEVRCKGCNARGKLRYRDAVNAAFNAVCGECGEAPEIVEYERVLSALGPVDTTS